MIREINSKDWPEFCKRLTHELKGATVKLETTKPDGLKETLATEATFQGIAFEQVDGCSDAITLRVRAEREIVHQMLDPIHVQLRASAAGAGDFNMLQIGSESGVTIITLHPAVHAKMLDGLKAG
jgi:hypothetical protein